MPKYDKQLVGPKQIVFIMLCGTIGILISLYREYQKKGNLDVSSLVVSLILFGVLIVITVIMRWWANRAEPGDYE